MTRDEVLRQYRPIRSGIRRVLKEYTSVISRADFKRALKQIAPWAEPEDMTDQLLEMMTDVALFEPNQRGRRAYDGILAKKAEALRPSDRALATRMSAAWFSLFRIVGRHEVAGLWLEDILAANRLLWMVDKSLEATGADGLIVGMRLFDSGQFHVGFGITVVPDPETVQFVVTAAERGDRLPVRHSLAVSLYGDALSGSRPMRDSDLAMVLALLQSAFPEPSLASENQPQLVKRKRPRAPKLPTGQGH